MKLGGSKPGEGMWLGDCVIESKVGTVDLACASLLTEIERCFFDRVGEEPAGERGRRSDMVAAPHQAAGTGSMTAPLEPSSPVSIVDSPAMARAM